MGGNIGRSIVLVLLILMGCRTAPVYDVGAGRVAKAHSAEEVGRVIEAAATELGWTVESEAPGKVIATLPVRHHQAVVTILYRADTYSIRYRDSEKLLYDGQKIHRNYNKWIQDLERRIHRGL